MKTIKHLFISASGELLPRWQEAFAKAVALSADKVPLSVKAEFVWLRLQAGIPVSEQITLIRERCGEAAIVVLSDTPDDAEGIAAFSAFARGYCNSHSTPNVFKQIAATVSQGGLWIGESLMERLLVGISRVPVATNSAESEQKDTLTKREKDVALAIAVGASNKEVARQLGITERTVKAHVGVLFNKLKVTDRLQLALRVRELHL